ncbi:phospholipase D family protein [Pantoea agglomerans]
MNKYSARIIALTAIAFIPCSFATVTTGFSPGGTALNLILQFSGSARQSMDVGACDFTSQPVAPALSASVARGVAVRLVVDEKKAATAGHSSALACAGVQVRVNGMHSIMHNKFIIADGSAAETGLFNCTSSAEKRNAENAVVITGEPETTRQYQTEFNRLWYESSLVICSEIGFY